MLAELGAEPAPHEPPKSEDAEDAPDTDKGRPVKQEAGVEEERDGLERTGVCDVTDVASVGMTFLLDRQIRLRLGCLFSSPELLAQKQQSDSRSGKRCSRPCLTERLPEYRRSAKKIL